MITPPTSAAPRRHLTAAITLAGAGILTAHQVQLSVFSMPSAALLRAQVSDTVSSQSTGSPAPPRPVNLTVGEIGARIVEGVATALAAPFVIAFFAVIWVVSHLQPLLIRPAASVLTTVRAAAAEPATRTSVNRTRARSDSPGRAASDRSTARRSTNGAPRTSATSTGHSAPRHAEG